MPGRGGLPAAVVEAMAERPFVGALDGFVPEGLAVDLAFRVERLVPILRHLADQGVSGWSLRVPCSGRVLTPAFWTPTPPDGPAPAGGRCRRATMRHCGRSSRYSPSSASTGRAWTKSRRRCCPGRRAGGTLTTGIGGCNARGQDRRGAWRGRCGAGRSAWRRACVWGSRRCREPMRCWRRWRLGPQAAAQSCPRRGLLYKAAETRSGPPDRPADHRPRYPAGCRGSGIGGVAFQAGAVIACLDLPAMESEAAGSRLGLFLVVAGGAEAVPDRGRAVG